MSDNFNYPIDALSECINLTHLKICCLGCYEYSLEVLACFPRLQKLDISVKTMFLQHDMLHHMTETTRFKDVSVTTHDEDDLYCRYIP